jgi:hypothetical protein
MDRTSRGGSRILVAPVSAPVLLYRLPQMGGATTPTARADTQEERHEQTLLPQAPEQSLIL